MSGRFGPKADPSYGGDGVYYLFQWDPAEIAALRDKPIETIVFLEPGEELLALRQHVLKPGTTDDGEDVAPGSAFGRTLTGSVEFTYDVPFYLVSVLGGFANDNGILNAMNSAEFGITAPRGATVVTGTGTVYAAAVPEPATLALLGLGLAGLGFGRWRKA